MDILVVQGRFAQATEHYIRALDKKPRWAELMRRMNDLAWMLATHAEGKVRDGRLAVRLSERICRELEPPPPQYLATWAAALAELGRFDEACIKAQKALAAAGKAGHTGLAQALKEQIVMYRSKKPLRTR